ncbi:hypothetical protein [Gluconacetobacter sp.]|uniref:hypothetical protein n=1 Tax=Gluconacetobacter sp. TaxID=1935994 RepID=UPI0039E9B4BD
MEPLWESSVLALVCDGWEYSRLDMLADVSTSLINQWEDIYTAVPDPFLKPAIESLLQRSRPPGQLALHRGGSSYRLAGDQNG